MLRTSAGRSIAETLAKRGLIIAGTFENRGRSLAIFRIGFGLLVFVSQVRFLLKGWVEACYLS
ncbi:MAG: hypothetical protein AAFY91_18190, partial [Bacteroidota bacterium]